VVRRLSSPGFRSIPRGLSYRTLPHGDRIVDFSYAGYMGGGVRLPERIPIGCSLTPSGGDDTAAIQRAIDEVSAMPIKDGIRGAVVLSPGTFLCSATFNITASGVVLHGSGPAIDGTTLKLTGEPHVAVSVSGDQQVKLLEAPSHIVEAQVPSGPKSITLGDASAFAGPRQCQPKLAIASAIKGIQSASRGQILSGADTRMVQDDPVTHHELANYSYER
jgi:hypothetical protein